MRCPPRPAALTKVGSPSPETFAARGIRVVAACGETGAGRLTLRATKGTKRKLGLRSRTMGRAAIRCAEDGTATLRMRPSRAVRRAIRVARPARFKVAVVLRAADRVAAKRLVSIR